MMERGAAAGCWVLVLAALCLQGASPEQRRVLEQQRHPFIKRFRRLEEQFRRFQDVTLTRLQGIAENYNISYNIDARFHHLHDQQQTLAEAFNASSENVLNELNGVKFWLKKVQKKNKNLDLKISALEESVAERNKQMAKENKARDVAVANLTTTLGSQKRIIYQLVKDKGDLQKGMEVFRGMVEKQGRKIGDLEKQIQNMQPNEILPPISLMAAPKHPPSSLMVAPQGPESSSMMDQVPESASMVAQDPQSSSKVAQVPQRSQMVAQVSKSSTMVATQGGQSSFMESPPPPSPLMVTPQKSPSSLQEALRVPPSSLIAAPEINRTPEEKQVAIHQVDLGPITIEQRQIKLQAKHSQSRKLHEEQRLLIPTKSQTMAAQRGEVTRRLSPSEEEWLGILFTTPAPPAITNTKRPWQNAKTLRPNHPVTTPVTYTEKMSTQHDGGDLTPPVEKLATLQSTRKPLPTTHTPKPEPRTTKPPGTICNVDAMLVFPHQSTENYVTFSKGVREPLLELSICSWIRTNATYVGTILSYATEENDNKLVLHGRNGEAYDSFHFVIGDPAYRELPLVPLIDGDWHHTCFIWSSIQGKYWYYVDRRLTSTGSRFQKGYEIPPGGSLVLGQEQDTVGGGFDRSEAFVGSLAGFAMWNRALTPGEVSGIATGNGLPRGTILSLADASSIHGEVRRVDCTCLEHCP